MATFQNRRRAPADVAPVSIDGVRYEVVRDARSEVFAQHGGILAAIDEASGRQLWIIAVYAVAFDGKWERDTQETYIRSMAPDAEGRALLISNERAKSFRVNLHDHSVTALDA